MKVKIHPLLTLALRYHPLGLLEGYFRKGGGQETTKLW